MMVSRNRTLALIVLVCGGVAIVMGVAFIALGVAKKTVLTEAMRAEKVTLGDVHVPGAPKDEIIDTAKEAQASADTIREHRRGVAPTYRDLLGEGRYDPTNPKHLSYAQALNMENYLYLAVMGFGLIDLAIGSGVFMIVIGIALGAGGILLFRSIG